MNAAEQDVHTHLTLMVLAFDCWAIETLGRSQNSLDKNIDAWIADGKPPHPMVTRVVARMREYVARLGTAPALPASVLALLKEPSSASPIQLNRHGPSVANCTQNSAGDRT